MLSASYIARTVSLEMGTVSNHAENKPNLKVLVTIRLWRRVVGLVQSLWLIGTNLQLL